jgi:hypothetical protein
VDEIRILPPARRSEASEIFDALFTGDLGELKPIVDGFVDVSLTEETAVLGGERHCCKRTVH